MLDYFGTKIEIPVKVIKEVVTDIKVDYNPIKTDYLLDESIDLTGLEGNVVYNSGVTKKLQDLMPQVMQIQLFLMIFLRQARHR